MHTRCVIRACACVHVYAKYAYTRYALPQYHEYPVAYQVVPFALVQLFLQAASVKALNVTWFTMQVYFAVSHVTFTRIVLGSKLLRSNVILRTAYFISLPLLFNLSDVTAIAGMTKFLFFMQLIKI